MTAKIIENQDYRNRIAVFKDRFEAGKLLSYKLQEYSGKENVIVLAVPAGGVPVGHMVASKLGAPMDVVIVRKIQIPWSPEAGFGAVTWDGKIVLNEDLVEQLGLTGEEMEKAILKTKSNILQRIRKFRGNKSMPDFSSKIVILVDDGLASGFTMLAA